MIKVFVDGAKEPMLECQAYGSIDIGGKLHLLADGKPIEVDRRLIVTDDDLTVLDVMEPNKPQSHGNA